MKKHFKISLSVFLVLCTVIFISSCAAAPEKLIVGNWLNAEGQVEWSFFEDGTYRQVEENESGKWTISKDKTLTLTDNDGKETSSWTWSENGGLEKWNATKQKLRFDGSIFAKQ